MQFDDKMADSEGESNGTTVKSLNGEDFDATLAINEDDFMAPAADDETNGGGDGACATEDESGGYAQFMGRLTLEDKVAWMENEMAVMRNDVEKIKSRMADLIEVQNGMTAQPGSEGRSVVTAAEFGKMLDAALASGGKYGVSRTYITRFICSEYNQQSGRYFQKKLGLLLKKKLMSKEYSLNDSLYTMNTN